MNEQIGALYRQKIERTVKALQKNRIDAHYVQDKEELLELIARLVPQGARVASGGSATLIETGVYDLLKGSGYDFYDRGRVDEATGEAVDVFREAFLCDWYFASANAITEAGELYNVDAGGNRAAALLYGPANVVIIAGGNKIVRDLDAAAHRVKNTAAPANCIRLGRDTPCVKTGTCMDCRVDGRICCDTVVQGFQQKPGRIKVFLLPEELGF